MMRAVASVAFLVAAGSAGAATPSSGNPSTDFGVRALGAKVVTPIVREGGDDAPLVSSSRPLGSTATLSTAAQIGSQLGRVTSMKRSVEHNRRVGGVANSYHLSGRAIDIARKRGVSHAQIAAALRAAGYRLIESLDEGDHSHFAFGFGLGQRLRNAAAIAAKSGEVTTWHMVYAPSGGGRSSR
ncbi:MAG TPA: D-Ala-D-Ala carboxypeptidase family metallohydrolase [Sphingomicrobium sp.]|jgi:hypothetical protein|nr:D-Ala-D-Ala carboxypeptidase family metallohydrolase [Sphingomicrobium sp.]